MQASGPSRHNLWIDGLESNDVILLHGELLFRGEFPAALTVINGTALAAVLAICPRPRHRGRGVESDDVALERGLRLDASAANDHGGS